jgi:glycosyltransferase involved in cell wall biosynthesis
VAVGRFVEKKAPHLSLLAFAKVMERIPAAELVFVGQGALLDTCKQLSRALGIEDRVYFEGAVGSEKVREHLQRARCFVQHSVTAPSGDREGTAISVLEAASCGLAIVATRHEGIAETMLHERTALLVDEFDIDRMAEEMFRVAKNDELASKLGRAAAQRVRQYFSIHTSIRRLNSILNAASQRRSMALIKDELELEVEGAIDKSAWPRAGLEHAF